MRILSLILLSAALLMAACDDDPAADPVPTDTGNGGDDTGEADVGDDTVTPDTGEEDLGAPDADATEDEPIARPGACDPPPSGDNTATFDFVTALQKFVGSGEIGVEGSTVSVVVEVPDEEDTTFSGDFEEDSNCVIAEVDDSLTADLCFFNADGTPSEPGTLGANLYAFIHGAPTTNPTATLLGGAMRGADRDCSAAGWYTFDLSDVGATDGNLTTETVDAIVTDFLSYLGLFDLGINALGDARASVVIGTAEPTEEAVDGDSMFTGDVDIDIPTFILLGEDEYDIDFLLTGSIDIGAGTFEGTIEIIVDGDAGAGTIGGELTGSRF